MEPVANFRAVLRGKFSGEVAVHDGSAKDLTCHLAERLPGFSTAVFRRVEWLVLKNVFTAMMAIFLVS